MKLFKPFQETTAHKELKYLKIDQWEGCLAKGQKVRKTIQYPERHLKNITEDLVT